METKTVVFVMAVAAGVTLYHASNWWERAYATLVSSETSPDGCLRIDTYSAFRVLPSVFHRIPDPDPTIRYALGRSWEDEIFKRAYEASTGTFLGETVVFDPSASTSIMYWGDTRTPGRRVVVANQFSLTDTDRCSDEATLAKLEAFYEREREESQRIQTEWKNGRPIRRTLSAPEQ